MRPLLPLLALLVLAGVAHSDTFTLSLVSQPAATTTYTATSVDVTLDTAAEVCTAAGKTCVGIVSSCVNTFTVGGTNTSYNVADCTVDVGGSGITIYAVCR